MTDTPETPQDPDANPSAPAPTAVWDGAGAGLVRLDWAATAVLAASTAVSAALLGDVRYVGVGVALVLFAAGCVAFLWAYAIAVQRSRTDAIGIGGLYFLAGPVAPKRVKALCNGALAVQVAVSVAGASVRPFTTLAFGTLAPMVGIGINGLWAARHGRFPPRVVRGARPASGRPRSS
ncbi:MAG: hypothetical protein ACKO91_04585 [Acidimicrobiales bacterium]